MNTHPLRIVSTGYRALLAKAYHGADKVFTEIAAYDLTIISINEHIDITPNPRDNG